MKNIVLSIKNRAARGEMVDLSIQFFVETFKKKNYQRICELCRKKQILQDFYQMES